jgi:hypothetical protein
MMTATGEAQGGPEDRIVLTVPFYRRRGVRITLTQEPPPPKQEPIRRPAKVARMLALAHHIEEAIRRGRVTHPAAVARELGFTRARVSQLLDLLLLSPAIQERVLFLEAVDGVEPMSERQLYNVARERRWWLQTLPLGEQDEAASVQPE